jgi:hypothetical protein
MHVALALLAMSAAPLAANPQQSTLDKQVSFEIRFVEMKGLGWRADFQQQLRTVSTREGKSAWTIDEVGLKSLLRECNETTAAPKVTTWEESSATVVNGKPCHLVSSVREVLDAPKGVIKGVSYLPKVASVDSGDLVNASGRHLEQGMLVNVSWDVQQVLALHKVTHKGTEVEGRGKINAQYQVPEIVKDNYKGEWLIPEDSALVLSMGPRTVAGPLNIAQVRERVLIVIARHVLTEDEEARIELEPLQQAGFSRPPVESPEPKPWMPTPTAPSRALPQSAGVDGSLPPLPDDTMHVTPESGEVDPKPTPQMRAPEKKPGEDTPEARPAGEPVKPVAEASNRGRIVPVPATVLGRPITVLRADVACEGLDRQEPFQNRSYPNVVARVGEAPTGMRGVGQSFHYDYHDLINRGLIITGSSKPAVQLDSEMVKAGLTEKMGSVMSMKLNFDSDALSRLKTETKVTRIPMAGNLALEISARVVPAPDVACDVAPECPLVK